MIFSGNVNKVNTKDRSGNRWLADKVGSGRLGWWPGLAGWFNCATEKYINKKVRGRMSVKK